MKKAVFLDRDGVLNQDPPHYVHKIEDMVILPRVGEAIKLLNDAGYLVIVVSNQSGVGRGMYSKEDVMIFNAELFKRLNVEITDSIFCPHVKEDDCGCRKPHPGMLFYMSGVYDISLSESWLVGDKRTDCEAADAAGVRSILVLTGHGQEEVKKPGSHRVSQDLYSAVTEYIVDVGK